MTQHGNLTQSGTSPVFQKQGAYSTLGATAFTIVIQQELETERWVWAQTFHLCFKKGCYQSDKDREKKLSDAWKTYLTVTG